MNAPPKILTEWIDIATCGLIAPTKERIRQEVEAHFADAVEARTAEGLTLADAEIAAVRELGDPKNAAWRFRKNHLTEGEVRRLGSIQKSYQRDKTTRLEIFMLGWFVFMFLTWNAGGWQNLFLLGLIGYGWVFFERRIRHRFFHGQLDQFPWSLALSKRFVGYVLIMNIAGLFTMTVACWITSRSALIPAGLAGWVVCAIGIGQVGLFRLWRKLQHVDEIPLGNA